MLGTSPLLDQLFCTIVVGLSQARLGCELGHARLGGGQCQLERLNLLPSFDERRFSLGDRRLSGLKISRPHLGRLFCFFQRRFQPINLGLKGFRIDREQDFALIDRFIN